MSTLKKFYVPRLLSHEEAMEGQKEDGIVIYLTYAVGYILQREIFTLHHDRAAGVF
jgi:hypothetical protein